MSGPDLYVVCKNCQAEVSPYITECPYCGKRLRKRAQLDTARRTTSRVRASTGLRLGRLRPGEIPGIRADRHPYTTWAIAVASVLAIIVPLSGAFDPYRYIIDGPLHGEWWRILSANFDYGAIVSGTAGVSVAPIASTIYALIAIVVVVLFGTGIEHRHGPLAVLLLFLGGGAAGMAVAAQVSAGSQLAGGGGVQLAAGGNAGALALLSAWAVPDLLARRRGEETETDGLGLLALAALLLLMPLATDLANPLAAVVGAAVGLLVGVPLGRRVTV